MSFYPETLISGDQGKYLKLLLAVTTVFLFIWTLSLWAKHPVSIPSNEREISGKAERGYTVRSLSHKASYNVIVKKDLFMPSRQKYEDAATAVQENILPRVAMAPPQLTLLGTVLLHGEEAALISIHGQSDGPSYFKVGDKIGGFDVKEIGTSSVLLVRGGQTFEIGLTPLDKEIETTQGGNKASQAAAQRQRRMAPNRLKRGQKPQRFKGRTAPPL